MCSARSPLWLFILVLLHPMSNAHQSSSAIINVTAGRPHSNATVTELPGVYGRESPRERVRGAVRVPSSGDALACGRDVEFGGGESPWIALVERGNCTFSLKIRNAAKKGAKAVVIFNEVGTGNATADFRHNGKVVPDYNSLETLSLKYKLTA